MKMCGLTVRFPPTPYLLAMCLLGFSATSAFAAPAKDEVTPAVQALFAKAKAAQQQGDTTTAIASYRETIRLAPHLAAAYHNLGMLYFNQHDYIHAEEILQRGV